MILDFMLSDCELSVTELWDLDFVVVGMCWLKLMMMIFVVSGFVIVTRLALVVRCSHVDCPCMFAGPGTISGNSTGPAFAITRSGTVHVLQGFVFEVWI